MLTIEVIIKKDGNEKYFAVLSCTGNNDEDIFVFKADLGGESFESFAYNASFTTQKRGSRKAAEKDANKKLTEAKHYIQSFRTVILNKKTYTI